MHWNVVLLGLQGSSSESSLLMHVMNQALTLGLDVAGDSAGPVLDASSSESATRPPDDLPPIHCCVPGASGPLGRCALVNIDDCSSLVPSPMLEQHLLDVEEVLEIFCRRKLYAKSSMCGSGRQELGFL